MSSKTGSDDALLSAAAAGDDEAFGVFYRRWLPIVVGFHLRRTNSRELAFDLTAETFAAVVGACGEFRPELGSAPAWLFSIARELLSELPEHQRSTICARVLEERSYEEIASELGCSEAVVRQRAHRGLSHMRERLQEAS